MAFSIRGLLFITACIAVACAALKYAGPMWWMILSTTALLLFMASTTVAFVGEGKQRARAIGFAVCFTIYAAVVFLSPANELNVAKGLLFTTKVIRTFVEQSDVVEMPMFGAQRTITDFVEHSDLLRIAHLLWAMFFGFLGSWFAGFVYRRNRGTIGLLDSPTNQ